MQTEFNSQPAKLDLPRPDVDFEGDLQQLVRNYPPLHMSRQYFTFQVQDGNVTVVGNVRSLQAKWMLVERVPRIAGVKRVDVSRLYDDETVAVAIADHLPAGLYATVYYGMVALTGTLPLHADAPALMTAVETTPGVRKVTAQFDQG